MTRSSSVFITLLLLLCLTPLCTSGQYTVVDLSKATSSHAPPSPFPARMIGLPAGDFGRHFPTTPLDVDLVALPADNIHGCQVPAFPNHTPGAKAIIVMVRRGNCSFSEKAQNLQAALVDGMMVVSGEGQEVSTMEAESENNGIDIPSFMVGYELGSLLIEASLPSAPRKPQDDLTKFAKTRLLEPQRIHGAKVFHYDRPGFDFTFIFMLTLAVGTVVVGAWLAASEERKAQEARRSGSVSPGARSPVIPGEETLPLQYLTTHQAFMFIVSASVMLLILFFFIKYLIYVLIVVFAFGACQAMTFLITNYFRWFYPPYTGTVQIPIFGTTSVYSVMAFCISSVLTVLWVVKRNSSGAWILQDVLGVSLLLVIQQSLRLPDIKVSSILLSMAFLYDIFWVFLSPYFFTQSVMVTVAQGGGTGEAVPMLLRLPRMQDKLGGYSMLGLGDIALPGLFISYLLRFDYSHPDATRLWRQSYFLISSIGYTVGLIATYVALVVFESGQPALLYLVPCTLGVIVPLALRRGDLFEMWKGTAADRAALDGLQMLRSQASPKPKTKGGYESVSTQGEVDRPDDSRIQSAVDQQEDEKEMMNNL